jgi:hypothetical protein
VNLGLKKMHTLLIVVLGDGEAICLTPLMSGDRMKKQGLCIKIH